jgi:hypothetical protein
MAFQLAHSSLPLMFQTLLCPTNPPASASELRVRVGYAADRNPGEAIRRARLDALEQMVAPVCADPAGLACFAARRNTAPYGRGFHDRQKKTGCASVALDQAFLNPEAAALEALEETLAQLGAAVRAEADAVYLQAPTWADTGCPAGELGGHLLNLLVPELAGVTLVDAPSGAARVRLTLSAAGDRVALAAALRLPGAEGWTAVSPHGASFPATLFQLDERDRRSCAPAAEVGLAGEQRQGDALAIQLDLDLPGGLLCAGEAAAPAVSVSAPARVRLYSVQADGAAFRVWPWDPADDRVYSPQDPPRLPPFTALHGLAGDERLVAVALPPEVPLDPVQGLCALAAPFDAGALPPEAALHTVTYHVAPAGRWICAARGDREAAELAETRAWLALTRASTCP